MWSSSSIVFLINYTRFHHHTGLTFQNWSKCTYSPQNLRNRFFEFEMWIVGKYLVLTHNMLSTAKVSKSQVDQGELLVQQSKAYNIYSTAAQLTLQNCQMFYNFTWPFHLKVKVLSLEINYAKDRSKPMMTTMAWCKPGHTSSLIDHGAVWDLLPWGAIQEFFGMAMKRILKVMMMVMTLPSDENAESWLEVVTREESSCEDRQSHRQAISHRCSHSAHNPPHRLHHLQICHNFSSRIHHFSAPRCASRFLCGIFLSSRSGSGLSLSQGIFTTLFSGELRHHYQPYVSGFGVIFPYFAYFSYFAYF